MGFFALDFETANESFASVCQVGIADFSGNDTKDDFSTLLTRRTTLLELTSRYTASTTKT